MRADVDRAAAGGSLRERAFRLVTHRRFQHAVTGLILANAATLGLETSGTVMARFGPLLMALDQAFLLLFSAEVALRIYACGGRFFRDPWSLFDLAVVAIAWVPASGPLSVLRALRVLRVLRLLSVVPSLRTVIEAMLAALPGMGSVALLLLLIFYVAAVMATKLYGDILPERFGTLGASAFTLFQLMTLDDWATIVNESIALSPNAGLFFFPFLVIATFVVLNLFIGMIVDSIQTLREERVRPADPAMTALQAEVAALRRAIEAWDPPGRPGPRLSDGGGA